MVTVIKRGEMIPAFIGFSVAAFLAVIIYAWRYPIPLEYFQRSAHPTNVYAGEIVTISWSERRNHWCDSIVWRKLIGTDGRIITFEPTLNEPKPVDVELNEEYQFHVPSGFAPGPLIYRATAEFRCNVVQRLIGGHVFVLPDIIFNYTDKEYDEQGRDRL